MESYVFISHSKRDSAVAIELVSFLEGYGNKCWLSSRDIRAGQNWAVALDAAIDNSKLMIFVLSSHSNQDKYQVIRELEEANNRRIPILTYRLEDVVPSHGIRFFVRASQFCDAFNRSGNEVGNDLIESIDLLAPDSFSPEQGRHLELGSAALPTEKQTHRGIRISTIAGGVILAMVVCVMITLLATNLISRPSNNKNEKASTTEKAPTTEATSLEQLAEAGDVKAQVELALKYANEIEDYEKSFFWSQKAADQNDSDGMLLLAQHYCNGRGVTKNLDKAEEWCEKSIQLGNTSAEQLLQMITSVNENPSPTPPGNTTLKQALDGDPEAQYNLGIKLINEGKKSEGIDWLRKAADQNYPTAMCELGTMYYGGIGLEKDNEKAVEWWTKAAAAGSEIAQHNLEVLRQKKGSD